MSCLSYRKKIQGEPSSFWVMGRRTDYWNVPPFSISLCKGSLFVFFGCQGNESRTLYTTTPRLFVYSCFWIDYSCYSVLFWIFQLPGLLNFENEPFPSCPPPPHFNLSLSMHPSLLSSYHRYFLWTRYFYRTSLFVLFHFSRAMHKRQLANPSLPKWSAKQ